MTGEEMERAIEFLVKNQANFDARMDRLEAAQAETGQQIRDLASGHQQTKEFLDEVSQIVAQNSRDIAQNTQQISHLSHIMENVVEGERRNTDDIDGLIKLVGGLIEGRNGKSQG